VAYITLDTLYAVFSICVQYYCERFGVCDIDVICLSKQWKLQADIDMDIRAGMIRELDSWL